ncbi:hypothetical protein NHX12_024262 [Muraenolepis orangiensis]|uniref:Uncharacterized protein n=1 Tax=Muraenolepis orangiensis TaxID=630683 RepID=A0A9Q0EPZ4_9TELE|nr:hypothetical protein NHX12_024262 [Muraenolepis orangiensis]
MLCVAVAALSNSSVSFLRLSAARVNIQSVFFSFPPSFSVTSDHMSNRRGESRCQVEVETWNLRPRSRTTCKAAEEEARRRASGDTGIVARERFCDPGVGPELWRWSR